MPHNPDLDLELVRELAVSPDRIWRAWTEPDLLRQWWCPKPWTVSRAVIEPRPGGRFMTVMVDPDGSEYPNEGCFLAIEPQRRIVFTDALSEGWRPKPEPFMTAEITIEPTETGARYTARVQHRDAADRKKHEEMGFFGGWATAIGQLETLAKDL